MDEKDDDKKRVLTPPSEWADGMKPQSSSEAGEIDESTDWLEDDDFEVPPKSDHSKGAEPPAARGPSVDDEASATEATEPEQSTSSDADAILTNPGEASVKKAKSSSKLAWSLAIVGFVVAGGIARETAKSEIADLKDTIRSMERSEKKRSVDDASLIADKEALEQQIAELQQENKRLNNENEALKNREAERTQRTIAASTKTASGPRAADGGSSKPKASSTRQVDTTTAAPPNQVGGVWFVNLESHKSRAVADERLSLLRAKISSTNLSIASATVNGQTYYRVRAAGYASKADATAASKWMAQTLKAGPFWIGKDSNNISQASVKTPVPLKQQVAKQPRTSPQTQSVRQTEAKQPVRLRSLPMRDNWFVFVDTYDSGERADEVISTLNGQGFDAKVAVESRSGELFYRVQIVGIESEEAGNAIIAQLKAGEFRNARLRKTVN